MLIAHRLSHLPPARVVLALRERLARDGHAATIATTELGRHAVERGAGDQPMRAGTITMLALALDMGVPRYPDGYTTRALLPGEPTPAEVLAWLDAHPAQVEGVTADDWRAIAQGKATAPEVWVRICDAVNKSEG